MPPVRDEQHYGSTSMKVTGAKPLNPSLAQTQAFSSENYNSS